MLFPRKLIGSTSVENALNHRSSLVITALTEIAHERPCSRKAQSSFIGIFAFRYEVGYRECGEFIPLNVLTKLKVPTHSTSFFLDKRSLPRLLFSFFGMAFHTRLQLSTTAFSLWRATKVDTYALSVAGSCTGISGKESLGWFSCTGDELS